MWDLFIFFLVYSSTPQSDWSLPVLVTTVLIMREQQQHTPVRRQHGECYFIFGMNIVVTNVPRYSVPGGW